MRFVSFVSLMESSLPFRRKKSFATIFPNATPEAVDFLTKTLVSPVLCF